MCAACKKPARADILKFHKFLCGLAICTSCYFKRQDRKR